MPNINEQTRGMAVIKRPKPDPYCAFKDDRERRNALISRDVRLVLMAIISALGWWLLH